MFAPLMDQMTTRNLSRRFTASQALEFLEGFASRLTREQLQFPAPPGIISWRRVPYEDFDRWEHLPDKFIKDWGHFREPKPSSWIRYLCQICDYDWGYTFVQWVRRTIKFGRDFSVLFQVYSLHSIRHSMRHALFFNWK